MREVCVTGLGMASALGAGVQTHLLAVRERRTGLAHHALFGGAKPDPCMCGKLPADVLDPDLDATAGDRADRLLGLVVQEAADGIDPALLHTTDLVVGTTLGNLHGGTLYYRQVRENRDPDIGLVKHFLPCAPATAAARTFGVGGRRWTISSACGSGTAALGLAFNRVRAGLSERVLAAGMDVLSPYVVAGFNSLRLVSASTCRPFDRNRDGLNPGEGGAALLVESVDSARARNAQPLAYLEGFGEALDAYHHTRAHPEGAGMVAAVTRALAAAGRTAADIDHIHLHGTATPANDQSEYHACATVFGSRLAAVPACSTKSMTGHTYGGAGALSAGFCILSLQHGIVPPTLFLEAADPEFEGLQISSEPVDGLDLERALSLTLGFGGESYALLIRGSGATEAHAGRT
jgi:3-oxoacyl-[acyl-carrier-protein] synthase II